MVCRAQGPCNGGLLTDLGMVCVISAIHLEDLGMVCVISVIHLEDGGCHGRAKAVRHNVCATCIRAWTSASAGSVRR